MVMEEGMIAMWSGKIEDIPNRWVLCDGANSIPDLRDKFIVEAGGGTNLDPKEARFTASSFSRTFHPTLITDTQRNLRRFQLFRDDSSRSKELARCHDKDGDDPGGTILQEERLPTISELL